MDSSNLISFSHIYTSLRFSPLNESISFALPLPIVFLQPPPSSIRHSSSTAIYFCSTDACSLSRQLTRHSSVQLPELPQGLAKPYSIPGATFYTTGAPSACFRCDLFRPWSASFNDSDLFLCTVHALERALALNSIAACSGHGSPCVYLCSGFQVPNTNCFVALRIAPSLFSARLHLMVLGSTPDKFSTLFLYNNDVNGIG
ncbi:hypothetical protein B0H19DRAFT_706200 [Mycena capillaripes]|nr:hypothetical protein B0H19DRAFT_706200 [Mycena capillaripes]